MRACCSSSPGFLLEAKILATGNGVPLHQAFYYDLLFVLVLIKIIIASAIIFSPFIVLFFINKLMQFCTARTVWSDPVIRPVLVRFGKCTIRMVTNKKLRKLN